MGSDPPKRSPRGRAQDEPREVWTAGEARAVTVGGDAPRWPPVAAEMFGPVAVARFRKDDGRALILYSLPSREP